MSSSLPPALDPCYQVRRTCGLLMKDPESPVTISEESIETLVSEMQDNPNDIQWDSEGWHYNGSDVEDFQLRKERVALYILALDAINFCFWPHPTLQDGNTLEYDHLAIALKQLAEQSTESGDFFFSPQKLSTLTEADIQTALSPHLTHYLPNLSERCRLWNELGAGLLESFDGSACTLLNACQGSAPRLVQILIQHFSGFRDESLLTNSGTWLAFYKRAQIAAADLNAALDLQLDGMEQLTTFADYRVPQLLRHVNVLDYNEELSIAVDNQVELTREQEVYVRAATVVAVDRLVQAFNAHNNTENMTAVKMDWHLWQVGECLHQNGKMKPHHRVNTIFY